MAKKSQVSFQTLKWQTYLTTTFFELYRLNNGDDKTFLEILNLLQNGTVQQWNKLLKNSNEHLLYNTAQIIVGLIWLSMFRPPLVQLKSTSLLSTIDPLFTNQNIWKAEKLGTWTIGIELPKKPSDRQVATIQGLTTDNSKNLINWITGISKYTSSNPNHPYGEIVTGTVTFIFNDVEYSPSICLHVNTANYLKYIYEGKLPEEPGFISGLIPAAKIKTKALAVVNKFNGQKPISKIITNTIKTASMTKQGKHPINEDVKKIKDKLEKAVVYSLTPPAESTGIPLGSTTYSTTPNIENIVILDKLSPIVLPLETPTPLATTDDTSIDTSLPLITNKTWYLPSKPLPPLAPFIEQYQIQCIAEVLNKIEAQKQHKKTSESITITTQNKKASGKINKKASGKKEEDKKSSTSHNASNASNSKNNSTQQTSRNNSALISLLSIQNYILVPEKLQEPSTKSLSILQLTFIDKPAIASNDKNNAYPQRTIAIPIAVDDLRFNIPNRNVQVKSIGDLRIIPKSNSWITYQLSGRIPYGISEINHSKKEKKNVGLYIARVLWSLTAQPDLYVCSHLYIADTEQYNDYCPTDLLGKYLPTGLQAIQTKFTSQDTYYLYISISGGLYV